MRWHPTRWRHRPLTTVALVLTAVATAAGASAAFAQTTVCSKTDFQAVVDNAAGALRELTQKNTPAFQGKLRDLKDKRGWSHEQFLKEASPFVLDDKIGDYDAKSEDLLNTIVAMGQEGSTAAKPDCTVLDKLKGIMQGLVETQQAKWKYMFGKLDAELAN